MYTGPARKKSHVGGVCKVLAFSPPSCRLSGRWVVGADECRVGPVSLLFVMHALAQGATLRQLSVQIPSGAFSSTKSSLSTFSCTCSPIQPKYKDLFPLEENPRFIV